MNTIDLARVTKIYFVGIKGVAMTALALVMKEMGKQVNGSDVADVFPTDEQLLEAGIRTVVGFEPQHIKSVRPDLVIYTGAHGGRDNPEVAYAIQSNIATMSQAEALGLAAKGKKQIVVAGCHGKTTTTAMIATILSSAGMDPSYTVGSGKVGGLGNSGHWGAGEWFVAEGDEYVTDPVHDKTPRFLWLDPKIVVVTNVDYDHPDQYKDMADITRSYEKLVRKLPSDGTLLLNADDIESAPLKSYCNGVVRVGGSKDADFVIENVSFTQEETRFSVACKAISYAVSIYVLGMHNVTNAALAFAAALCAGVEPQKAALALKKFRGAKRRFELVGTTGKGMIVIDDYAHHPREIAVTLKAARQRYVEKMIHVIFQPHTYTRTRALLEDFVSSFDAADRVWITDIYASAREKKDETIDGEMFADMIGRRHPSVGYISKLHEIIDQYNAIQNNHIVLICMGAGDIADWSREIVRNL